MSFARGHRSSSTLHHHFVVGAGFSGARLLFIHDIVRMIPISAEEIRRQLFEASPEGKGFSADARIRVS